MTDTITAHWVTGREVRYAPKPEPQEGQGGDPLWQQREDQDTDIWGGQLRECATAQDGCPAIFPMTGDFKTAITEQWQYYVRAINYGMGLQYVAALFGPRKAFTNRNPDIVCADWLRRRDLDKPPPWWDKVRTTSRSVMTGVVVGDRLRVTMLDGSKPPPLKAGRSYPRHVNEINPDDYLYMPRTHRHMFCVANIVKPDGRVVPFANGAVYDWIGDNRPYTFIPHISRIVIEYPLKYLIRVSGLVSPYKP